MAGLVDTNVLVYRYDPSSPSKRDAARALLRARVESIELYIAHQSLIEFVNTVTRPVRGTNAPLLSVTEAIAEAETLLSSFPVLFPNRDVFLLALRGMAAYGISWFDANIWACAEYYGLDTIYTEDAGFGTRIGDVRIVNPFA